MHQPAPQAEIIQAYFAVLDQVTDTAVVVKHYPALQFPASLLPYPKAVIHQALRDSLKAARIPGNELQVLLLERGLAYLTRFTESEHQLVAPAA